MKNVTLATIFVFLTALIAPAATPLANAQGQAQGPPSKSLAIPVSAENFTGTFTLTRFANVGGAVQALGTLAGVVTTGAGPVSLVRTVALPVEIGSGQQASTQQVAPQQVTATCDILHLELGPLDLDLLGLVVHLNRIVLDIDAQSGPGNLLGNLLCAVTGLLDNPGGLAQVLNQILAIIGA
jgi:hypothetical protein